MNILFSSLNLTLSVFTLILLGYLLSRKGILKPNSNDVLSRYVFFLALPAEIFITSKNAVLASNNLFFYILCYIFSICVLWFIIIIVFKVWLKKSNSEIGLSLIAVGQTNTAYLAIPIFIILFGNSELVIPIIVFQTIILTTISIIIIETSFDNKSFSIISTLKKIPIIIIKNPLILSSIIGVVYKSINLSEFINNNNFIIASINMVAQSAAPIALIALGASFYEDSKNKFSRNDIQEIVLGVSLKNFIHPLLSFILGKYVFHLNSTLLLAVILISAMPSPKNTFILAQSYNISAKKYNSILILSTLCAFFTINFICISLAAN